MFSILNELALQNDLHNFMTNTVKPRLSGMQLSGNTAIRTVFLGNEKTLCNFAPFSGKSVFPEPDSSLGNQSMFYNDHWSVLSILHFNHI